jgi:hypothetical protein
MTQYREPSDADLDAQIARAQARGEAMKAFYASDMRYDESEDTFFLRLYSGATVTVPRTLIPRFGTLTTAQLRKAHLAPGGNAIIVNDDVDYSVPAVLRLISGIAEQRRTAGSVRSEKKAAAVRVNGAKGGRPKTTVTIETKNGNRLPEKGSVANT